MATTPAAYEPSEILDWFETNHLPDSDVRKISKLFGDLATTLDKELPASAEKSTALRKLLEAKDAGVRAKVGAIKAEKAAG